MFYDETTVRGNSVPLKMRLRYDFEDVTVPDRDWHKDEGTCVMLRQEDLEFVT